MTGLLIAIEGIDGAGKSTQARRLADRFSFTDRETLLTREPTDGVYGRRIRAAAHAGLRLPPEEELELFAKDRAEHVDSLIAPSLERGCVVITDRYYLSSVAYQGARGLDPVSILEDSEARFPLPDCALILRIPVHLGLERIERRERGGGDAFEEAASLARVAEIFDSLDRPYVAQVEADGDPEQVSERLRRVLCERLDLSL